MTFLKEHALTIAKILGGIILFVSLLPGGLSPVDMIKATADQYVADGDFETITPALYNRLRPVLVVTGFTLLAFSYGFSQQKNDKSWLSRRTLLMTAAVSLAFLVLLLTSIAVFRLNSPFYRYLVGTPLAQIVSGKTPTPAGTLTPTPIPTITLTPTPTRPPEETPMQPGSLELILKLDSQPTVLVSPYDGTDRLFIGMRSGQVHILQNGDFIEEPFLDLTGRILNEFTSIEQGLIGLVFHPNYAENGYFYVYYIDNGADIVVSRFQVDKDNPAKADPESEYRLFGIVKPDDIHHGGQMVFGIDGYLYISVGDGGIQEDPNGYAQSTDTLQGKILRIDVDSPTEPYGIPADNPLVNKAGLDEIIHWGLRNPWRFSFDSLTNDLYIADVGFENHEEINFIPAGTPFGLNFGWNYFEGNEIFFENIDFGAQEREDYTWPILTYYHHPSLCAVVGGYVYRGSAIPDLYGKYIYGDYCTGFIWAASRDSTGEWNTELIFDAPLSLTSFGVDDQNEIYALGLQGEVMKLKP